MLESLFLLQGALDVEVVAAAMGPLLLAIGGLWQRLKYVEDSRNADNKQNILILKEFTDVIRELTKEVERGNQKSS